MQEIHAIKKRIALAELENVKLLNRKILAETLVAEDKAKQRGIALPRQPNPLGFLNRAIPGAQEQPSTEERRPRPHPNPDPAAIELEPTVEEVDTLPQRAEHPEESAQSNSYQVFLSQEEMADLEEQERQRPANSNSIENFSDIEF